MDTNNSLFAASPELAAQWHPFKNEGLLPTQVSRASGKRVWWQCPKGHAWEAKVCTRAAGRGCPICRGRKVLEGYNDLATVNPELAAEWHSSKNGDLLPTQVTAHSSKKVWWHGRCGHDWPATVYDRSRGTRCPYCYGTKVPRKERAACSV